MEYTLCRRARKQKHLAYIEDFIETAIASCFEHLKGIKSVSQ